VNPTGRADTLASSFLLLVRHLEARCDACARTPDSARNRIAVCSWLVAGGSLLIARGVWLLAGCFLLVARGCLRRVRGARRTATRFLRPAVRRTGVSTPDASWLLHTRRRTIPATGRGLASLRGCRWHECRARGGYAKATKLLGCETRYRIRRTLAAASRGCAKEGPRPCFATAPCN
jgi:hypothetical protein